MESYKEKYIKYKMKYFLLKKSIGGAGEVNWKNEPKFVPKFNDNTQKEDELRIFEDNQVIKYKWHDEEAKDIMPLRSGIINKSPKEVVNSLFKEFVSKIFNYENIGSEKFSLFKIKYVANKDNCFIELVIEWRNKEQRGGRPMSLIQRSPSPKSKVHSTYGNRTEVPRGFGKSLGWSDSFMNNGLGAKATYPELFKVYWQFVNEKTGAKEYFDKNKHFREGFFGQVKKATIDDIEIDIEKFKNVSSGFKREIMEMSGVLQEFTGMINEPNSNSCTDFLKKFHDFWNESHLKFEFIKK